MNNITKVTEDRCTGCGACYNKCPKDAIEMRPGKDGYLFPAIDEQKCIDCGLCVKACPAENDFRSNSDSPDALAVWAPDNIREKSSSGGMFSLLAAKIFDMGGVVIGAAFTDDFYGAEHRVATNIAELAPLRGSKYVQSDTKDTYSIAKRYLDEDKPVLYTGCPCQIAGLYGYLGKDYEKLYTVDLVCHGTPSAELLKTFVQEEEEKAGAKAVYLAFRDKMVSKWGDLRTAINFANGKVYRKGRRNCPWLRSFLNGLTFRESCGKCKFAAIPRQGDITIADFWDIHRHDQRFDDSKGTSLVIVNNPKGKELTDSIRSDTKLFEYAPLEHAIKYNRQIKYSSLLHKGRRRFFAVLKNNTFENAVRHAMDEEKYDIGYIGWWYGKNWGSMMTCYAMNRVLTGMGKSVLMLPFPSMGKAHGGHQGEFVRTVAEKFYNEGTNCSIHDYHVFNDRCETFLVGSDQLWNWWSNRDVGSYYYFCDFADDKHKKIAYSTSFGHESGYYPEDMKLRVAYLLSRFDAISVREKSGIDILKRGFGADAVQTMDPVFLCSTEQYQEMIDLSELQLNDKYILGYFLNPNEDKVKAIQLIAQKLKRPYKIIVDGQSDFEKLKADTNDSNVIRLSKVEDWLKYFRYAEHVVTDSFHGFCYSIIFSKEMTIFPNKLRGLTRFESIADMTGLGGRFVYSFAEVESKALWTKKINYKQVHASLKPHIDYSIDWLKKALDAPKSEPGFMELLLKKLT